MQQAGQRGGHLDGRQAVGVDVPALRRGRRRRRIGRAGQSLARRGRLALDDPLLDEHLDKLLDVERVALGPFGDEFAQGVGHGVGALQDLVHQGAAGHATERVYRDDAEAGQVVAPLRPALEQGRPGQAEDEQVGGRFVFVDGAQEAADEVERAVVGPVDVLQQHGDAPLGGQAADEAQEMGLGQGGEVEAAGQPGHGRTGREVEAQPVADDIGLIGQLLWVGCGFGGGAVADEAGAELVEGHGGAVAVENVEAEGEDIAPEAIGHPLQGRRGAALEVADTFRAQIDPVVELVEQAALAHAGLADDGDDAGARLGDGGSEGGL